MSIGIQITEASANRAATDNLGRLAGRIHSEIAKEIDRINLDILRDSKTVPPRVPVDTGALQGSGHVEPATIQGSVVSGQLTYGGAYGGSEVDYAVHVHENMAATYKRPGAGPKFVEAHFRRRESEIETRLHDAGSRAGQS